MWSDGNGPDHRSMSVFSPFFRRDFAGQRPGAGGRAGMGGMAARAAGGDTAPDPRRMKAAVAREPAASVVASDGGSSSLILRMIASISIDIRSAMPGVRGCASRSCIGVFFYDEV